MKPEALIKQNLAKQKLMQVATTKGERPWICTVHYVGDEDANLYWLSLPSRRHSKELSENNRAAVAVVVKGDKPVIGLQAEGRVSVVDDNEQVRIIMKKYVEKFNIGGSFYDNFVAGKNQHSLYKFTPDSFALFDELNFPDDSPQTWKPAN